MTTSTPLITRLAARNRRRWSHGVVVPGLGDSYRVDIEPVPLSRDHRPEIGPRQRIVPYGCEYHVVTDPETPVADWCKENCKGEYFARYADDLVNFADEEDAVAFKLHWVAQ